VTGGAEWDALIEGDRARLVPVAGEPDALLSADLGSWDRIARDVRGGMTAYRQGRLQVRRNLHLGVGLLAATSASTEPGRLRFAAVKTPIGEISYVEAGVGNPLIALHGLGGTKASFLPTLSAMADTHRVIAIDLPGFGDSAKPIAAPYDARWFARAVVAAMDGLEIDRAHLVGNSMGGRVALETALRSSDRVDRVVLLCPALAWLRRPPWAGALRFLRPELGLFQVAPRPVVERVVRNFLPGADDGWAAAGVDEFLRSYLTPRGRAAFYASARNILLDAPAGENGFWARLSTIERDCLFIWGQHDTLVPVAFRRHVEGALPSARHVVLDCGHVPQVEAPHRTHPAMLRFLD
jgi:pimeloyl-ACP methyl ester carboxylesterase